MTSWTTPVGVVVLALAGAIAVGCTAQTSAVFEALLDPAAVPASPSEAEVESVDDGDVGSPTWWPHPDGYALQLPPGWSGVSLSPAQTDQLLDAVGADLPALVQRVNSVLDATRSEVSMIAADTSAEVELPPVVLVMSQPTDGRKARFIKARTHDQIATLPGLRGGIIKGDERLPNDIAVRYDYVVDDADLGPIRIRSYLFRFGRQAYLVNFVVSEGAFEESEGTFDDIVASIRFGV